jgi:pimeloyl-ACP methyl ester carboxylesterase
VRSDFLKNNTEESVMNKLAATIVLVHGAWADGSSWNKVIPLLRDADLSVVAVQIPLTSVQDDIAATSRIIADLEGPIILVGHSWGGMAITQAGNDAKVAALVYVSAFAPDVGETGSSLIGAHPTPPALSTAVTDKSGFVYQTTEGVLENMAPDIPVADAQTLAVTQKRLAGKAFVESVSVASWKSKPCWFIVTAEDRVVSVELQAAEAERMAAKKTVIQSSHMSLLSHPKEVASVIMDAVSTVAITPEVTNATAG